MIPVLIVPCLNRPDLLQQMLDSVDDVVGLVYIIDNGGVVADDIQCAWAKRIHIVRPGANLGVAASWNLGIKANLYADWWFIVNNDIVFAKGVLGELIKVMNNTTEPLIGTVLAFGAFAINAPAVEAVGIFDENFSPLYYEDTDWAYRADILKVPNVRLESATEHVNNGENSMKAATSEQQHRFPGLNLINRSYFQRKWGNKTYQTPFNEGGDVADWFPPPLSRLRETHWKGDQEA